MLNILKRQGGSVLALMFKLFKVLKSVKLLLAGATLATYSYLQTWEFAVAIMWAIGVHELGHVWAMRYTGMRTPGFYFVPLFGGAAIGDRARTEWQDVFITAMGPTWGLLSAIPPALLFLFTGEPLWASICGFIGLVNLFNLLPIYPLDGGRLTHSLLVSVAPGAQLLYLVAAGMLVLALAVYMQIYLVAILFVIGVVEINAERRAVQQGRAALKPPLNAAGLRVSGLWYIALALIFLLIIYSVRHIEGADLAMRVLRDN